MQYLAGNLKALRKVKDLTQEQAAEMLGVSPQSVSKWERGDSLPDIALLPALANLYNVSTDALIGMDKINGARAKGDVFTNVYAQIKAGGYRAAADTLTEALRMHPGDEDYTSYLAITLALEGGEQNLRRAAELAERVQADGKSVKNLHTTRAALCFIYFKAGERDRAVAAAHALPHTRESREVILAQLEGDMSSAQADGCLKLIATGEQ